MFNDYRKSVAYEGSAFLIQHTESAVFLHKPQIMRRVKTKRIGPQTESFLFSPERLIPRQYNSLFRLTISMTKLAVSSMAFDDTSIMGTMETPHDASGVL